MKPVKHLCLRFQLFDTIYRARQAAPSAGAKRCDRLAGEVITVKERVQDHGHVTPPIGVAHIHNIVLLKVFNGVCNFRSCPVLFFLRRNIQKLIVAREIEQHSPLLIAAEPTRGVDIGAMEFIHNKLLEKREQGDAVLLISSELTEIMSLSDRIYVIYEGRAVGEFHKADATEEGLGILMMGGTLNEAVS